MSNVYLFDHPSMYWDKFDGESMTEQARRVLKKDPPTLAHCALCANVPGFHVKFSLIPTALGEFLEEDTDGNNR